MGGGAVGGEAVGGGLGGGAVGGGYPLVVHLTLQPWDGDAPWVCGVRCARSGPVCQCAWQCGKAR